METINKWDAKASEELKKKFKEVKTFSDLSKLRDEYLRDRPFYPKSEREFFEEFKNENNVWKLYSSFWEDDRGRIHYFDIDYIDYFFCEIENPEIYQKFANYGFFNFFYDFICKDRCPLSKIWPKINNQLKDRFIQKAIDIGMRGLEEDDRFDRDDKIFKKITSHSDLLSLASNLIKKAIQTHPYVRELKALAFKVKDIDPKFYDEVEKAIKFTNKHIQDKLELIAKFINELLKNFPQNDFNYHLKSLYYLSFMFEEEEIDPLRRFHKYKYFNSNLPTVEISYDTPPFFATNPEEWENIEGNINIKGGKRERISEFDPREKRERISEFDPRENNDSNYRKYIDKGLFDVEQLLGVYIARENKIILYERGIQWFAKTLSCDVNALREKVFIHELAHWATHQLPLHTEIWPLKHYENTERNVHEGLAQLLCYWTIESLPEPYRQEYIDAFKKLNQNQTPPYHVYKQFLNYSKHRIINSIDRMRDLDRPATLNDWKNIV